MKVSSAPFLLLRIPSLKLRVVGRKEAFEANLKTETELWHLMVKEMWAGRLIADQHKVKQRMRTERVQYCNSNLCRDMSDVKLIQRVICLYDLVFICVCGYAFLSVNLGELVGVVKGPRGINNQKYSILTFSKHGV